MFIDFTQLLKDGTKVPYVIISEKGIKPKAQLIYVYGAYGAQLHQLDGHIINGFLY